MLIHQGWFTALYTCTQHLLDSQSLEFEICIFPREAMPSYYFPLREDSSRVLAWGLHGQGNSVLAVVIIPPLTLNVTCSRDKTRQKACSSTKGGLMRYIPNTFSILKVSSLKFAYFQGRLSRHSRITLKHVPVMRMRNNNKTKTDLYCKHQFCFGLLQKLAFKHIGNYSSAP